MGKYRATINMPEAKRFAVAEFPDDEPRVIRMVLDGHLVPVDVAPEVKARIEEVKANPPASANNADAVRAAMAKAREDEAARLGEAEGEAPEGEGIVTSFTPGVVAPTADSLIAQTRRG